MSIHYAIKSPPAEASLTPLADLLQRARAGDHGHGLPDVAEDEGLHAVYERLEKLVG